MSEDVESQEVFNTGFIGVVFADLSRAIALISSLKWVC